MNIKRFEPGRCSSCGDCNREADVEDLEGEYVLFEDVKNMLEIQPCSFTPIHKDPELPFFNTSCGHQVTVEPDIKYCMYCGKEIIWIKDSK